MKTHKNENGIEYYSKQDESGDTVYSFSKDFEDYWTQDNEALYGQSEQEKLTQALIALGVNEEWANDFDADWLIDQELDGEPLWVQVQIALQIYSTQFNFA